MVAVGPLGVHRQIDVYLVDCLVEIVKLLFAPDVDGATGVLSWNKLHEFVGERFENL